MRSILHCDLNNFYVSVACRDNPSLREKVVAVGGSTEERHGIILAKNERAKKLGIKTGDALWQARQKCPNLIVVKPDFKRYTYFSKEAKKIYCRYTDLVEPFGIDECWLDVTGSRLLFGEGHDIAEKIRAEMKNELGLTVSVGVSFNKIFAKLGSDLKKPDATSDIPFERFREVVWPLEANVLLGVGRATECKLRSLGIFTVGDLAAAPPEVLRMRLGKAGEQLWHYANGRENSPVLPFDYKYRPQSVGRSTTCPRDLLTLSQVKLVFLSLADEVAAELRKEDMEAHAIQVTIRDNTLEIHEFMKQLEHPVQSGYELALEGLSLLGISYDFEKPLRSVGIRAIKLFDYAPECQLSFFEDKTKTFKREELERSMDKIRGKYGKNGIVRASLMHDRHAFGDQSPSTLGRTRLSV